MIRIVFAAIILAALWRPSLRGHGRPDLLLVGAFGLTLAAMNVTFYESIDRIPLGAAVTLEFVGPLGVAVAGSRRALDLLWVALAAAGILLLAGPGGGGLNAPGVILALAAGGWWAAYILLSARTGRVFPGGSGLALAMVIAAVLVLPVGLVDAGGGIADAGVLVAGLGIAVMSSLIPYSLEFEALKRMPTRIFGVLMSLEPAAAAIAGLILLDQVLKANEWAGMALVIAASAGATLYAGRSSSATASM